MLVSIYIYIHTSMLYVHVCMYACLYMYECINSCIDMNSCMHVCMHTHICMQMYIYRESCMHSCMPAWMHVCVCIYIYMCVDQQRDCDNREGHLAMAGFVRGSTKVHICESILIQMHLHMHMLSTNA